MAPYDVLSAAPARRRRARLPLRGTLTAYSTRVTNPQTGGSTSTRTYYIGEQRLILPFDTENVCRQVANQPVHAFVVYVHKSNPLNWGQPGGAYARGAHRGHRA